MLQRNSSSSASSRRSLSAPCFELELPDFGEAGGPLPPPRMNTVHMAQLGAWLFESRRFMSFSLPTLYLAVGLLDRLRQVGFVVGEGMVQLLGATALLLSSKFNEVEQIRVQKLNDRLGKGYGFTLEQYREMEGDLLQALGFSLTDFRSIYLSFCDLHERFSPNCPTRVQNFCKICLQAPDLQRYGIENLVEAIGLLCERNRGRQREASKCVKELVNELEQLESSDYL